jgi:uracil-DNA glycosylase|tara:strand:- start:266868 stop:267542 length:675 start_codon:yes stop_codon:yes gene_type:complete
MRLDEYNLGQGWLEALATQEDAAYFKSLSRFLAREVSAGKQIYPAQTHFFKALSLTPLQDVKVVILGQDPYHGEGQAHGLSFSVPEDVKVPPSLVNIYKELESDLGIRSTKSGLLERWARQGVLLLNSVLSVEAGKAGSHRRRGWEQFTDVIIEAVNQQDTSVVFMLWGSYAQKKASFVDTDKHLVLKSVHPSPLSAYRGFLGCKHFSQANGFLVQKGRTGITW